MLVTTKAVTHLVLNLPHGSHFKPEVGIVGLKRHIMTYLQRKIRSHFPENRKSQHPTKQQTPANTPGWVLLSYATYFNTCR